MNVQIAVKISLASEQLPLDVNLWLAQRWPKVKINKDCIARSFAASGTDKIFGGGGDYRLSNAC